MNYEPNSLGGPIEDKKFAWVKTEMSGQAGRHPYSHPNCDFE